MEFTQANSVAQTRWDVGSLIDRRNNNAVLEPDLLDALVLHILANY
jgi:hypothetical protein